MSDTDAPRLRAAEAAVLAREIAQAALDMFRRNGFPAVCCAVAALDGEQVIAKACAEAKAP